MLRYPVFEYVVPENPWHSKGLLHTRACKNTREVKLRRVFQFILRVATRQGEIVAPTPHIEAVAIWSKSEDLGLSVPEALCTGVLTLPLEVGLRTTTRLLKLAKQKQVQRRKMLKSSYQLLDMLAVDPEYQGKGYGRLLIEAKLEELDRTHTQCYLETSDVRNIGYYQRYGFGLIYEHSTERVPVYCLLRPGR